MRRLGLLLGAAFLFGGTILLGGRRYTRIAVSGHSMEPSLRDGDWLLVDRLAAHFTRGDIVVALDPRSPDRPIVKRVAQLAPDSLLLLSSDHPAHAGEAIGPVARSAVVGRVVLRYRPISKASLIRGANAS